MRALLLLFMLATTAALSQEVVPCPLVHNYKEGMWGTADCPPHKPSPTQMAQPTAAPAKPDVPSCCNALGTNMEHSINSGPPYLLKSINADQVTPLNLTIDQSHPHTVNVHCADGVFGVVINNTTHSVEVTCFEEKK